MGRIVSLLVLPFGEFSDYDLCVRAVFAVLTGRFLRLESNHHHCYCAWPRLAAVAEWPDWEHIKQTGALCLSLPVCYQPYTLRVTAMTMPS